MTAVEARGVDGPARACRPVAVIADARSDRQRHVCGAVAAAGAELGTWPPDGNGHRNIPPSCRLAVVSVDASPTSLASPDMSLVRQCAAAHVRVIAYGDHADQWPLGIRCGILLAGAAYLVDSARPEFAADLQGRVAQILAAEESRLGEEERLRATFRQLGIVGESETMLAIFRWAVRVSRLSDLHVLITGETGTGKQLLAEAVHALDPKRRHGPFVALNCGAISPGLAESELFGHRRGAFTGAERDRKGLIRTAHGGVLFLDEVGELEPALQTKVLRVLQDGRVLGVGEDQESPVSLRVIAATNRNLQDMVRQRTFRGDLFHRLNILSIHVPPLRERPADVAPLVAHFLAKHAQLGAGGPLAAAADFIAALTHDGLPGNVRELENLVRRAIVQKDDPGPLSLSDLPPEVWAEVARGAGTGAPPGADQVSAGAPDAGASPEVAYASRVLARNGWNLARSLASCERSFVEAALEAAAGNQSETARLLGITARSVYNKIRKHHLANVRSVPRTDVPEARFPPAPAR